MDYGVHQAAVGRLTQTTTVSVELQMTCIGEEV